MITNPIAIPVDQLKDTMVLQAQVPGGGDLPFPLSVIGRGTYCVGFSMQTTLDQDVSAGIHNVQIGNFCSLATAILFMVNMNHDYKAVSTSGATLITPLTRQNLKIRQRGQILIQNDVWIGHGATIMSGVTIHNGAVIAANAHVVKDVPSYAIVGGNPARVIQHRFSHEQITDLLNIAWWGWDNQTLAARKGDFALPIDEFITKYRCPRIACPKKDKKTTYLFFPDFDEPYPIWQKVIRSYCEMYGNDRNKQLLIHIPQGQNSDISLQHFHAFLQALPPGEGQIHVGQTQNEAELFERSSFYITTRARETVWRSCLADRFGVHLISGVDKPLF